MKFTSALPFWVDPDKFSDGIFPEDSIVFLDNVSHADNDKKHSFIIRT